MFEIGSFDYNEEEDFADDEYEEEDDEEQGMIDEEEDEMPLSSQQEDLPKLTGPSPWERAIAAAEAVAARYEGQEDEIVNWSDLDEEEEEQEAPKYPEFYGERPKNFRQGTYEYLHKQALANDDARVTTDTFSGVKQFEYRCASCGHGTKQPQIGHKVDWKQHAFSKGAKNRKEVLNWYNDRSNLRFECQDCNTGHAFEEGPDGEYLE